MTFCNPDSARQNHFRVDFKDTRATNKFFLVQNNLLLSHKKININKNKLMTMKERLVHKGTNDRCRPHLRLSLVRKKSRIGVTSVILSASEELKLDVRKLIYPGKNLLQRDWIGHTGSIFHLSARRSETPLVRRPRSPYSKTLLVKGEKELRKMQADPGGWR